MSDLITKLGIDWKILIAQLINFGLVVFVLWKFAYRPVIAMLEKRTAKIEGGIKNAERIEQELKDIEIRREQELKSAHQQARAIVEKARQAAEAIKSELKQTTEVEVKKMMAQAKASLVQEKAQMIDQAKHELREVVQWAAEKVLGEKLDDKADTQLIQKVVESVRQRKANP